MGDRAAISDFPGSLGKVPVFLRISSSNPNYLAQASLNTTNRYAKVDLDMKRRVIAPVKAVAHQARTPWHRNPTILDWLESLSPTEMWSRESRKAAICRASASELHITHDCTFEPRDEVRHRHLV